MISKKIFNLIFIGVFLYWIVMVHIFLFNGSNVPFPHIGVIFVGLGFSFFGGCFIYFIYCGMVEEFYPPKSTPPSLPDYPVNEDGEWDLRTDRKPKN